MVVSDGLYRTLTQIESLQRTGDLSPTEVAALRRQIGDMVKRGMALEPHQARDLSKAARRCAKLPEPAIHPRVRRDVYGQLKSTGQYELPGPRMGPAERTRRRLSSAERQGRELERLEEQEIQRELRKNRKKYGTARAVAGRRKQTRRSPTFNEEVAARNATIAESRARSTPPSLQHPIAAMIHVSGSAAQAGLTVTEPSRRQKLGARWVERDGKYVWQRASGSTPAVEQGLQRDLVSRKVEEYWQSNGTDMTRSGADMVRLSGPPHLHRLGAIN